MLHGRIWRSDEILIKVGVVFVWIVDWEFKFVRINEVAPGNDEIQFSIERRSKKFSPFNFGHVVIADDVMGSAVKGDRECLFHETV